MTAPEHKRWWGCLLAAALALGACSEAALSADPAPGGVDAGADTSESDAPPVSYDTGGAYECAYEPGEDSDEDGLPDIVEDADRDCVVDSDETDPHRADTDGDGLLDGDEDVDRNGVWDRARGEFNPRVADSDGDGVRDADEALASVCSASLFSDQAERRRATSTIEVFLPDGVDAVEARGDGALQVTMPEGGAVFARTLTPPDIAALEPLGRLGAFITTPTGWRAVFSLEGARVDEVLIALGLESMVPAEGEDPPGEQRDASGARVSVDVVAQPEGAFHVAVAVAEPEAVPAWWDQVRADAIVDLSVSRIKARCELVAGQDELPEADFFIAVAEAGDGDDSSARAVRDPIDVVREALSARASRGAVSRTAVVLGDAHESAAAGALLGGGVVDELDATLALLDSISAGTADQRIWMNLRLALEATRPSAPVAVVVATREDAEFRFGEVNGFDGHPFEDALPAGEVRASLTAFYAGAFAELGVARLVAVSAVPCDGAEAPPASLRDIAVSTGGAYVDLCVPGASAELAQAVFGYAATELSIEAVRPPIRGTVTTGDGATDEGTRESGAARIGGAATSVDVPIGYLYAGPSASTR